MLSILLHLCVDMIFGPTIDSMIVGFTFGMASNVLNNGEYLWRMDKL